MPESKQGQEKLEEIKQLKRDYQEVFGTAAGKRVLAHLEKLCFINRTTYSQQRGRTLLHEGMRFVCVHIKNMMNMDMARIQELLEIAEKGE